MGTVDSYWLERWKALDNDMGELVKRDDPACVELKRLLEPLQTFARAQFEFFYFGFGGSAEGRRNRQLLEPSLDLPAEYVLKTILDQTAYDYSIICLAIAQREKATETATRTLQTASRLAEQYLGIVKDRFFNGSVDVVTYFRRGSSIRVIPYANVALIGVPPTSMIEGDWRDLLAVGHEVGHYVYWNGIEHERLTTVLDFMNRRRPAYIRRWQEEIFADVFGALVTGHPAVLNSARDMLADNAPGKVIVDDGVHPIDALRLHAYQEVSDFLQLDLNLDLKEFQWEFEDFETTDSLGNRMRVSLTEAGSEVRNTVRALCSFLHNEHQSDMFKLWRLNRALGDFAEISDNEIRGDLPTSADPQQAQRNDTYRKWAEHFQHEEAMQIALGPDSSAPLTPAEEEKAVAAHRPRWFQTLRERFGEMRNDDFMPPETWRTIFWADGWASSDAYGPETNPPKGGWERR